MSQSCQTPCIYQRLDELERKLRHALCDITVFSSTIDATAGTTSPIYTDLNIPSLSIGPSVTLNIPPCKDVTVTVTANIEFTRGATSLPNAANGNMSFQVSNSQNVPYILASDATAFSFTSTFGGAGAVIFANQASAKYFISRDNLQPGQNTFIAKYSSGLENALIDFQYRNILVEIVN
jgi:hypothetical protein